MTSGRDKRTWKDSVKAESHSSTPPKQSKAGHPATGLRHRPETWSVLGRPARRLFRPNVS